MESEKRYFLPAFQKTPGHKLSEIYKNSMEMANMERHQMLKAVLDDKELGDYRLRVTHRYGDGNYEISVIFFQNLSEKKSHKNAQSLTFEQQRQIIIDTLINGGLNSWEIEALSFSPVSMNNRIRCCGQSLPTEFDKIALNCPGTEITFSSPNQADLYVAADQLEAAKIASGISIKGALTNIFPGLTEEEKRLISKFAKKDGIYLSDVNPEAARDIVETIIGRHSGKFSNKIHDRLEQKKRKS